MSYTTKTERSDVRSERSEEPYAPRPEAERSEALISGRGSITLLQQAFNKYTVLLLKEEERITLHVYGAGTSHAIQEARRLAAGSCRAVFVCEGHVSNLLMCGPNGAA